MAVISELAVELALRDKRYRDQLKGAARATGELEKSTGRLGKALGRVSEIASGFIVANVLQRGAEEVKSFITGSIGAASDLNESISKTNAVFGDAAKSVIEWSRGSASAFGLSQQSALEYTSTIANLLKGVGVANKDLPIMSENLIATAADLGSFNNVDPAQVIEDLRSGLVGQAEPLRKYGILLSEAAVAQKAVDLGLADSTKTVSEAAKVQARYALIMEQVGDAQGDFAKTSSGLANGQRILAAHFKNFQAFIGSKLTPTIAKVVSQFNKLFAHITKLTGRGVKPADAVMRALQYRLTKLFGKERAAQIMGTIRTIIRAVELLRDAFLRIVDGAKLVVKFLLFLTKHLDIIAPMVVGLVGSFLLFQKVIPAVKGVVDGIKALRVAMMAMNPWMLVIAAAIALLYLAWTKNWFGIRDKTAAVIKWLIGQFKRFREFIQPAIDTIKLLGDYFHDVAFNKIQPGNLEKLPKWLRPIAWIIGRLIKTVRIFVKVWQDKGFLAALQIIPMQLRALGRVVANLFDKMGLHHFADAVRETFYDVARLFKDLVSLVDNLVHGRWGAAWKDLTKVAVDVFWLMIDRIKLGIALFRDIFNLIPWSAIGAALWSGFKSAVGFLVETGIPWLLAQGIALLGKLWEGLKWSWDNVVLPGLLALPGAIVDLFAAYYTSLYDIGNYLLGAFWSGLQFAWDWGVSWAKDLPGRLVGYFNQFYNWFYGVGNYLVSGLWAGFSNAWSWLVNQAVAAWNQLPDFIKKVWGIMSPSRVFAEIGENAGLGLAQGILDAVPKASRAVDKLAQAATVDMTGSVSASLAGATGTVSTGVGASGMRPDGPVSIDTVVVNNPVNGDEVVGEILRAVRRKRAGRA